MNDVDGAFSVRRDVLRLTGLQARDLRRASKLPPLCFREYEAPHSVADPHLALWPETQAYRPYDDGVDRKDGVDRSERDCSHQSRGPQVTSFAVSALAPGLFP